MLQLPRTGLRSPILTRSLSRGLSGGECLAPRRQWLCQSGRADGSTTAAQNLVQPHRQLHAVGNVASCSWLCFQHAPHMLSCMQHVPEQPHQSPCGWVMTCFRAEYMRSVLCARPAACSSPSQTYTASLQQLRYISQMTLTQPPQQASRDWHQAMLPLARVPQHYTQALHTLLCWPSPSQPRMPARVPAQLQKLTSAAAIAGIELLLGMYSLPRLPPMFASSHAGHALNAAMRSFTSSHGARLSLHLSRALSAQLKAALTCIQVLVGPGATSDWPCQHDMLWVAYRAAAVGPVATFLIQRTPMQGAQGWLLSLCS